MISAPLHAGTADQALTTGFEVTTPSSRFVEKIPRDFARLHMVVSAGTDEVTGCERLLVSSKTPSHIPHNVGTRLGAPTRCVVNDDESIAARIDAAYTALGVASEDKIEIRQGEAQSGEVDRLLAAADRDLLSTAGKGPVVRLVDAMLFEALAKGASDVHIQPLADRVLVRYRVDGVLLTARVLPRHVAEAVSGRIKVMGRMDVAERRIPQDGRAGVSIGADTAGRKVDLRISSLPTSHGERIVVRLLDTSQGRKLATLDDLGMPIDVQGRYLHMASRPQGVILLTGPTGSGKTTTLYATLRWIAGHSTDGQRSSDGTLNVMTIEDPIEYELSGLGVSISQAQVNTKKGVTFASGLRHILRQDPDVIMVGEIRDEQTARIAIQASLTGHLVFSTLHTNSAAGAISRLVDLGIEPFLIGSSLSGAMAQRLARRIHRTCRGAGCDSCMGIGHAGRVGLFELLRVTPTIRAMVGAGEDQARLIAAARADGLRTLREEGMRLVSEQVTSEREVLRVTLAEDEG